MTRHQRGFTVIHPTPAFPSPVTPGGTGSLGFSLSSAPSQARPGNARQGGDRPGHCLDYVSGISQPPSTYSLTTCDLTSQEPGDLRTATHPARTSASRPESAAIGNDPVRCPHPRRARLHWCQQHQLQVRRADIEFFARDLEARGRARAVALNGLRVSEATGAEIDLLGIERGHRTLVIAHKDGKVVTIPLAPRTARQSTWRSASEWKDLSS